MNEQSNTPETDAKLIEMDMADLELGHKFRELKDFARKLERERDEARKALDEILDEVIDNADSSPDAAGVGAFCTGLIRQHNSLMMGDRLSARRERDQLRKVADELAVYIKAEFGFDNWRLANHNNLPHVIARKNT